MVKTPTNKPIEWVTNDIIRQIFNESQLASRASNGELILHLKRNSHPEKINNEPYCTNSQIVYYYSQSNVPLAVVHQYLRPDGTLGGSGKPDPKRIFLPDKIISIRSKKSNYV
jgi:hypothetical protein